MASNSSTIFSSFVPNSFSENRVIDRFELEGLEVASPEMIAMRWLNTKAKIWKRTADDMGKDWHTATYAILNDPLRYAEDSKEQLDETIKEFWYWQYDVAGDDNTFVQLGQIYEYWDVIPSDQRTEIQASLTLGVLQALISKKAPRLWRGGNVFNLREIDATFDKNGKWLHGGISVNIDPLDKNIKANGGAFEIKSLPEGLTTVQSGRNKNHYLIVPENKDITKDEFQNLLNQVELHIDNPNYTPDN